MTTSAATRAPDVGESAPDFTLESTAGEPVSLGAFRGKANVLLAFFPLAFTRVCTAELCDFSEDFDRFAAANVILLPISVDSVPTLREFRAKHNLEVDLLSDFKRDVSRAYGVLLSDRFYSTRAYFLIGRDGRIAWRHIEESPSNKRSDEEILEQVSRLG